MPGQVRVFIQTFLPEQGTSGMKKRPLGILVEIGHPAHVHFFRYPINIWQKAGHNVVVVTRDKEITHQLLNELGIAYIPLSRQRTGLVPMMFELLYRWMRIFLLIKSRKIDISISISGISTAFPSWLAGIPAITCTDTEDAVLSNRIAFPFSDVILTPSSYLDAGKYKRLKTYPSYHEMAYLHPKRFKPDVSILRDFGLTPRDRYVFVRLVKWKALHDVNEQGISEQNLDRIIRLVQNRGMRVFLSSERGLDSRFDRFLVKTKLSRIFDLMAFSSGYIGESPTMSVETAILGRPSVLINSRVRRLGNMVEMQEKYGLHNFLSYEEAEPFLRTRFFTPALARETRLLQKRLLRDKIDIAGWLARFVPEFARGGKR
jgi:uncharacterized protein